MTSKKQIQANGQNAQKSTGPKTPAGRRRSSQNAVKHGLCSESLTLPGEDEAEIEEYRREIYESLELQTPLQRAVGNDIANLALQLRRSARVAESTILRAIVHDRTEQREEDRERYVPPHILKEKLASGALEMPAPPTPTENLRREREWAQEKQAELGRAFARDVEGPNALEKSMRYTTTIRRNMIRMIQELSSLKEDGL